LPVLASTVQPWRVTGTASCGLVVRRTAMARTTTRRETATARGNHWVTTARAVSCSRNRSAATLSAEGGALSSPFTLVCSPTFFCTVSAARRRPADATAHENAWFSAGQALITAAKSTRCHATGVAFTAGCTVAGSLRRDRVWHACISGSVEGFARRLRHLSHITTEQSGSSHLLRTQLRELSAPRYVSCST